MEAIGMDCIFLRTLEFVSLPSTEDYGRNERLRIDESVY
jgi:hypothetical protein